MAEAKAKAAAAAPLERIRAHIKDAWGVLTRSHAALADAAFDDKVEARRGKSLVYVPADEDLNAVAGRLRSSMEPAQWDRVDVRALPKGGAAPAAPGLLYLPRPYVVPGGRFNEMYGWDSYFIAEGLLRAGEVELAKGMAENHLYQVRHYGKVLNANRTYYLTRSQPPLLSRMVLAVYAVTKDRAWLAESLPSLRAYHRFWTSGARQVASTGLSRYYDDGDGAAPEVAEGERDREGLSHYDRVKRFLREHDTPGYPKERYYDHATDALTERFYKGDRAMRESGFDPSDRFGLFNSEVCDINPVCLNSLLYRMELDLAEIEAVLGASSAALSWSALARQRRETVNALMWDEEAGLYFDYDHELRRRRPYPFVASFYPLWTGAADAAQAARLAENVVLFERPGGLVTSTRQTGKQWDSPYGWAPMQQIAAEGLRRYGFAGAADRISLAFLSLVLQEFLATGVIVEKYDVVKRRSDVSSGIAFGYSSNEVGFGWTNSAFEELLAALPQERRAALSQPPLTEGVRRPTLP